MVEILPLYVDRGAMWLLRPESTSSLQVDWTPQQNPAEAVQEALAAAALDAAIVHSTSWRYEDRRLVITYLAILHDVPRTAGMRPERVGRVELARGTARGPAADVAVSQVVEHGLRHLCWLSGDDAEIGHALDDQWLDLVADYRPEPFRAL